MRYLSPSRFLPYCFNPSTNHIDPEDTYGQSRLERSCQETGSCLSPRGKETEGVALERVGPNYLEVYSLPKSSRGDFDVVRIESSKTSAEHNRYSETEQRDDLFNNHLGGLVTELSENVQKKTCRNFDRPKSSGGIHRHSDSRLKGCRFQNSIDRGHRLSSRRWNDPPTQNGSSVSTAGFSVAVVVGNDFEPHELTVKAVDGRLVVHAERSDSTADRRNCAGLLYREFDLPGDVEPETITANLTPEGILLLEAPKTVCNCVSHAETTCL